MTELLLPLLPAAMEDMTTVEWQDFFRNLLIRVGGSDSLDMDSVYAGLIALTVRVTTLEDDLAALTVRVTTLEVALATLEAALIALEARVALLETGYGCAHGHNIVWSQAAAVQNTWYPISDTDMDSGALSDVVHDGNGKLTVGLAGAYLINWSAAGDISTNNDHIEIAIRVDGTEIDHGLNHFESSKAGDHFGIAGSGIIALSANSYVEISVRTILALTPTIAVDHLNLNVVRVGG